MSIQRLARIMAVGLCLLTIMPSQFSFAADAKKRPPRVEEQAYQEPAIGVAFPAYEMAYCVTGCVIFEVQSGDRYVSVEASDAVGPEVALAVFPWDGAATDPRFKRYDYCSSTEKPLRLPSWAARVWIEVLIGPCSDGTPAAATRGTVTASFSR